MFACILIFKSEHTKPGRYIVSLPDQFRMLKDPHVCPQELAITVSIVRRTPALGDVLVSISSRISYQAVDKKSTFPSHNSYPSPKAKTVFVQYHVIPQLSARLAVSSVPTCRDGKKILCFLDFHLQRSAENPFVPFV